MLTKTKKKNKNLRTALRRTAVFGARRDGHRFQGLSGHRRQDGRIGFRRAGRQDVLGGGAGRRRCGHDVAHADELGAGRQHVRDAGRGHVLLLLLSRGGPGGRLDDILVRGRLRSGHQRVVATDGPQVAGGRQHVAAGRRRDERRSHLGGARLARNDGRLLRRRPRRLVVGHPPRMRRGPPGLEKTLRKFKKKSLHKHKTCILL